MLNSTKKYKALLEYVACNICGAENYDIIYRPNYENAQVGDFDKVFRSSGDEILIDQLVKCRECGLSYLNPRPKKDLIIQSYSSGSDEKFISQVTSRERTFSKCLDIIEHLVPVEKILDIGTAGGSFLGVGKKRGWEVVGCEPNIWLSNWGRKHYNVPIHSGTVFDMKLDEASFDVITLWDVLEHTPNPKSVLSECNRLLKPGGLLVINYPDIGSLAARFMGRKWVFLLSVHLYYFTQPTIGKILNSTGFEVVKYKKHWQTLELGYILSRMKPYMPSVSSIGSKTVEFFNIQNTQMPYWIGQSLVLANKKQKNYAHTEY